MWYRLVFYNRYIRILKLRMWKFTFVLFFQEIKELFVNIVDKVIDPFKQSRLTCKDVQLVSLLS